jgi:hypothetical protein
VLFRSPGSGTNLIFSGVSSPGNSQVTTSGTGPTIPTGFSLGDSPTYYDISTTATYDPPVQVCIAYNPSQYDAPELLRLLHYENNTWVNVTTSNDLANSVICGQVNALSPFVVAQAIYNFSGFFQPVDNTPTLNAVNAGRAIPVKFSLGEYHGLNIFAAGSSLVKRITCAPGVSLDEVEETTTAGSSSLTYDSATSSYIYVWKTDKAWAGTCRQLVVLLNDGTFHLANFKFR